MTSRARRITPPAAHFNPHEREARDDDIPAAGFHDRDFNPHEREARDPMSRGLKRLPSILIHTSVKLVTVIWHLPVDGE